MIEFVRPPLAVDSPLDQKKLADAPADPNLLPLEQTFRQFRGLELIASENLTSLAVMEANGSMFTNKCVSRPSPLGCLNSAAHNFAPSQVL